MMPYIVAFAYTMDETNHMADILLPEATDLESTQLIRVGGTKFQEVYWDSTGFALRQPVVAARGGAIEEVCGDAAEYVDPLRVEEIARGLRAVLTEAPLRARLVTAGRVRAALYEWRTTARAVSAIYDELLS